MGKDVDTTVQQTLVALATGVLLVWLGYVAEAAIEFAFGWGPLRSDIAWMLPASGSLFVARIIYGLFFVPQTRKSGRRRG